jgi:hypothetical protein
MPSELDSFLKHNRCPKCYGLVSRGVAHGRGFVVGYGYCYRCHEFTEFVSRGLEESKVKDFQEFLINTIKGNY